jgi:bacteriocin biosynthesis cyclodehydratase domain-containing protein
MKLLINGSFGNAVGKRLGNASQLLDFIAAPAQDAQFIAVALTHKRLDALRALDDWCFENKRPWALAFLADAYLYCGPVFMPGQNQGMGCFECFYKRDLTHLEHAREPRREIAIDDFFNRHMEIEVGGFTAGAVGMAAAFLKGAANGDIESGRLRRINLVDGTIEDTEVLSTHHCPRCSSYCGSEARDKAYAAFTQELNGLLK